MNPNIINYSFSSSTQRPSVLLPSIGCGTCRQACLDRLCVLLDRRMDPQPNPCRQYSTVQQKQGHAVVAKREIPFVVCNCCAHRLPENVTGILIFNRHSAFVRTDYCDCPSNSSLLAHLVSLDSSMSAIYVANGTTEASANHWLMDCFGIFRAAS